MHKYVSELGGHGCVEERGPFQQKTLQRASEDQSRERICHLYQRKLQHILQN